MVDRIRLDEWREGGLGQQRNDEGIVNARKIGRSGQWCISR